MKVHRYIRVLVSIYTKPWSQFVGSEEGWSNLLVSICCSKGTLIGVASLARRLSIWRGVILSHLWMSGFSTEIPISVDGSVGPVCNQEDSFRIPEGFKSMSKDHLE